MIFNSVDFQKWMFWIFGQETELFIEFLFDGLWQETIVFPKCFSQDNFYVNNSAIPAALSIFFPEKRAHLPAFKSSSDLRIRF